MIYYFSATGNSQHVATRIAEALGTQAQSIETAGTEIRLADHEPLGFVTPTNWNELPVLVREFIRKAANKHVARANAKFLGTTSDKFYSTLRGFIIASLSAQLKSTE